MSAHSVTVRHNAETGHRLPHLGGKCQSLHGHSWWVEATVEADELDTDGTVLEFGKLKKLLREWIDTHLDHGLMLGRDDVLADLLAPHGKVFVFGRDNGTHDLPWPTVEAVAVLLSRVVGGILADLDAHPRCRVTHVRVTETHVNAAEWRPARQP